MPLLREIGPLVVDPTVASLAQELLAMNPVVFKQTLIEQISHPVLNRKASEESLEVDLYVLPHVIYLRKSSLLECEESKDGEGSEDERSKQDF